MSVNANGQSRTLGHRATRAKVRLHEHAQSRRKVDSGSLTGAGAPVGSFGAGIIRGSTGA